MTTSTLESKFPVMAVEHGCIVSKDADITVAFRVTLPEVFSVREFGLAVARRDMPMAAIEA